MSLALLAFGHKASDGSIFNLMVALNEALWSHKSLYGPSWEGGHEGSAPYSNVNHPVVTAIFQSGSNTMQPLSKSGNITFWDFLDTELYILFFKFFIEFMTLDDLEYHKNLLPPAAIIFSFVPVSKSNT